MKRILPLVLALSVSASAIAAPAKALKIFILAGQSNMQGHVNVSTFDSLTDDPKTAPILRQMRTADGKPRARSNRRPDAKEANRSILEDAGLSPSQARHVR